MRPDSSSARRPDVRGFGVMTAMPGFTRSGQSLIFFGLPLRTRNTIVDVYGALLFGSRLSQFNGSSFACCAMLSMSAARASVTTSPGKPSMTRARLAPRPAVRLIDAHRLAGLRLPILGEGHVERLVSAPRVGS